MNFVKSWTVALPLANENVALNKDREILKSYLLASYATTMCHFISTALEASFSRTPFAKPLVK